MKSPFPPWLLLALGFGTVVENILSPGPNLVSSILAGGVIGAGVYRLMEPRA